MKSALAGLRIACYTLLSSDTVPSMVSQLQGHSAPSHFADEAAKVQGLEVAGLPVQKSLIFIFSPVEGKAGGLGHKDC